MISQLATGPSYQIKIAFDGSNELVTIGFATKLNYTVSNGQKVIYTVDTPMPVEIAQGAGQVLVRGNMSLLMPRWMTLETLNLSPQRTDASGDSVAHMSKYFHLKVFDRLTQAVVLSLDYCKIGSYSVDLTARSIVTAQVQFDGMLASPGVVI